MNPPGHKLKAKGIHTVNIHGDWTQYTDAIPKNGIPLGTVKVGDTEGALIRTATPDAAGHIQGDARKHNQPGIRYLMITREGFVFALNHRMTRAALHQAGMTEPSDPLAQEPPLKIV